MIYYKIFSEEYSDQVSELLSQLGYNVSKVELPYRISKICEDKKGLVFLAFKSDKVVGCVHTMIVARLAEGICGEIVSLVVDKSVRNEGIGKGLINQSIQWLKQNGISKLRVRCNSIRNDAHKFYNHLGFTEKKSQKVFEKLI